MPTGSTSRAPPKNPPSAKRASGAGKAKPPRRARRRRRRTAKSRRWRHLRPLKKESEKLEQQLAAWQGELKLLETRLADPTLYADADSRLLDDLTLRQSLLTQNIEAAESRWLEIHELLEHD
jgi:ATP-binding cassette subfamily F protein 3